MDKRYDHLTAQEAAQELWTQEQVYTRANNPGPLYSIDTPPPTVSGNLHVGHIFSYTQTDILARYHRMSGFCVFYPFGFDDNGLPTERYVEKKQKVQAHALGRSAFIKLCLEQTQEVEKQFKALWQQIGLSVDWNQCYSTISKPVRKISQESFILLYKAGHVYRKQEPALYCTTCRTSVAQAELEDKEQPSTFNDIVFSDSEGNELIIATTRPELLPSSVALFYHPDDKRYQYLQGKTARVPLFNYEIPILTDALVDPQKGTGLVMCCTFGDKNDIHWYKKHKLEYKQSIGLDGKLIADIPFVTGLKVAKAREAILELLKEKKLVKTQKPITHTVNVHERCGKEIEFVMIPQWFLRILEHKKTFLALAEDVNWFPEYMKHRYINWVENISWDWCLSRQRFYGIAFPVWLCQTCDAILLADIKDLPIDPQETAYPGKKCPECASSDIIADPDVMDTWNTSSLTPYICLDLFDKDTTSVFDQKAVKNFIPMNMRPQAHDIIRTWAFYTIVKAWMHNKTIPWDSIVISGHVLSDKKEKLSKSKANDPLSPENLLKRYSADAIRYWTASGGLGNDISFSETQLNIGKRLVTKIWNAFRFIAEHTPDKPKKDAEPTDLINQWISTKASNCFASYQNYFAQNEFSLALDQVEHFFWKEFCDNYLELIKDQLFNPDNYDKAQVQETKQILYHTGLRILQLYAPYLPFVTETIYQLIYRTHIQKVSVHQTRFEEVQKEYMFKQSIDQMDTILYIIAEVRRLKTEKQLSLKTELARLLIYTKHPKVEEQLTQHKQLLKGITHANKIDNIIDEAPHKTELVEEDGAWHATLVVE